MRGKLNFSCSLLGVTRITPADAGKTSARHGIGQNSQDHPRGCGENDILSSAFKPSLGSPPRMRGKRDGAAAGARNRGITPADAGKTWKSKYEKEHSEDHPRGCGENTKKIL